MKGWKTWTGAAIIGIAAALEALGYPEIAVPLSRFGEGLTAIGIAHKVQKIKE